VSKEKRFTLLCAEDDQLSREMIVEYLEESFKEIYEASDGKEALALYEEKRPDVIISDINMPQIDGLTLIRTIRKRDKTTPIILLTAYTNTEYLIEAVELNLIKYLVKPLDDQKLDEALQSCFKLLNTTPKETVALTPHHTYDYRNNRLLHNHQEIKLTLSQQKFLTLLIENKSHIVSYDQIANHVWENRVMTDSALRSLIHNLRKLIHPAIIENISKQGYRIRLHEPKPHH